MKKLNTFIMALILGLGSFSCVYDFDELNTNPNLVDRISPGTLLNPIIYGVSSFNTSRADAFTFQLMQVALPFPSAAGGVHRYDITEAAGNSTWNTYYRWLINIKEMEASAIENQDPNYEAIALTLRAWVYSLLTDSFGDVPFHEASRAEDGILRAKFDGQEEIYAALLEGLERANSLYDLQRSMIFGEDILFQNNVSKWQKFTNSLHLRLLMRISNREETGALSKMAQIIQQPEQYPVFNSSDDSAILRITGVAPNLSPWGRAIDFTTFRAMSEFFIDNLNELEDPRRSKFSIQARDLDGQTAIGFKGIPSGYISNESAFEFIPSNHNIALVQVPMISLIMTYAEVEFIKAELAQKGVISSNPEAHYQAGVEAAMNHWGIDLPLGYFDNPAASYDGTLERVMLQKYLALYFNDYQQWFEYRRTGYPVLPKQPGMLNNQQVPVRFRYPVDVQIHNRSNYQEAVARMGGDDINTKVWWEK
ncbi:SusD/RagB family nutrient-binding outer membrane lipoprotein [Litoribacter alkaliphilus]|uniref:SusD/RagB family nutrient-binding outer membrane lipoprotein n=1 Tax=Litoribacter ruber TaxID=702568 RepID=A0AAP2CK85_9BACT|nr:SusD/RagB family nutrient-binding outer membrane lipoprotein [Litoribacter alkaliphilus]MBS9525224.1 SusD/RagB family nutrient-binding outer membrane lipoprotein [Litoribacter alkaliphilus]